MNTVVTMAHSGIALPMVAAVALVTGFIKTNYNNGGNPTSPAEPEESP